jgi:Flp pilus assembly protein TadG
MTPMRAKIKMFQAPITEHAQSQKGSVLVEFALILPIFLILLFGMVTFSVALYNKTVLTMATRDGARAGVKYVSGTTTTANPIRSKNASDAAWLAYKNNLISFGPSITPDHPHVEIVADTLTVRANINYTGLYIFSYVIPISAQTSMRLE